MLIFSDSHTALRMLPHCLAQLWLHNILNNITTVVDHLPQKQKCSLYFARFHRERWHSGKWLTLPSCFENCHHLQITAKKGASICLFLFFCKCVSVSSLYDQTGSCSPQEYWLAMPIAWLWTQIPNAYGNMTVTGNVQHVSQSCNRAWGDGVLENGEPSQNWGLVLMLAAQPGGSPEWTTLRVWEQLNTLIYSQTFAWTCTL